MSKTRYTLSADDLIKSDLFTKANAEALLAGLNASGSAKQLDVLVGGTGASAFTNQKLVYYDAEQKRLRSSVRGVVEPEIPALPTNLLRVGDAAGGGLTGTYPNPALPTDLVRDGDAAGGDLTGTYPNPTVLERLTVLAEVTAAMYELSTDPADEELVGTVVVPFSTANTNKTVYLPNPASYPGRTFRLFVSKGATTAARIIYLAVGTVGTPLTGKLVDPIQNSVVNNCHLTNTDTLAVSKLLSLTSTGTVWTMVLATDLLATPTNRGLLSPECYSIIKSFDVAVADYSDFAADVVGNRVVQVELGGVRYFIPASLSQGGVACSPCSPCGPCGPCGCNCDWF